MTEIFLDKPMQYFSVSNANSEYTIENLIINQ
jgi:levanase/fructan beta-fructosidase